MDGSGKRSIAVINFVSASPAGSAEEIPGSKRAADWRPEGRKRATSALRKSLEIRAALYEIVDERRAKTEVIQAQLSLKLFTSPPMIGTPQSQDFRKILSKGSLAHARNSQQVQYRK